MLSDKLNQKAYQLIHFIFLSVVVTWVLCHKVWADEDHHQHGSHVHGEAVLNIVLEKRELMLEIESPSMNILGFEHAPKTDEQKAALEKAEIILRDNAQVIKFEGGACTSDSTEIEVPDFDHADKNSHSEFHIHYVFHCSDAENLNSITVKLFEYFPGFQKIDVQWIFNAKQGSTVLTRSQPAIFLRE